ncbi:MAG: 4Fe-4S ferredoxin [Treponema sp.]|nr:4Fe-4S ferredoxin [Treponema sp.]
MITERKNVTVNGKLWIKTWQGWSWVITIAWMTIANIWHPFGLYGLVCMFTPIIIALAGFGKMSCARICPRGSFIGLVTKPFASFRLKRPEITFKKGFKFFLWALMMGSFIGLMVWTIPKGDIYKTGFTILVFMEAATVIGIICGILFTPRMWCTICPMGNTTGTIRDMQYRKKQ